MQQEQQQGHRGPPVFACQASVKTHISTSRTHLRFRTGTRALGNVRTAVALRLAASTPANGWASADCIALSTANARTVRKSDNRSLVRDSQVVLDILHGG